MSSEQSEDYFPHSSNIPTPPMTLKPCSTTTESSPVPQILFTPPSDPVQTTPTSSQSPYYFPLQIFPPSCSSQSTASVPITVSYSPSSPQGKTATFLAGPSVYGNFVFPNSMGCNIRDQTPIEHLTHPVWHIPKPRKSPTGVVRKAYVHPVTQSTSISKSSINKAKSRPNFPRHLPLARTVLLEDIMASQLRGMTVNNWMFHIAQLLRPDQPSAWKQCQQTKMT